VAGGEVGVALVHGRWRRLRSLLSQQLRMAAARVRRIRDWDRSGLGDRGKGSRRDRARRELGAAAGRRSGSTLSQVEGSTATAAGSVAGDGEHAGRYKLMEWNTAKLWEADGSELGPTRSKRTLGFDYCRGCVPTWAYA